MLLREKVDRTLVERQAVQEIVHRVRRDSVSVQELEQIGARLHCAGPLALHTLLRALGKEEDPELISRYAYLLDFFEEEEWLSPLMGIALRRRDLPEQGRVALLNALQEYGVDVDDPPFSSLLPASPRAVQHGLSGDEPDDDALVTFLDDFLGYPTGMQLAALRELAREGEPWVVRVLKALLWHEEPLVVEGALEALGKVRLPAAAAAVLEFLPDCPPSLVPLAQLTMRRLSFLGVVADEFLPPLPFHHAYVSAPDGEGYRSLLLSRWEGEELLTALYLQVHERRGLLAAWGGEGLEEATFIEEVEGFGDQEELYRVDHEYVLELVRDALYWSRDLSYLPADFYLRRDLFRGVEIAPAPYRPDLKEFRLGRCLSYQEGETLSEELLEDPLFGNWILLHRPVYELAREYRQGRELEKVLEDLCGELLAPQVELVAERLLSIADLMRRCGRERALVVKVVALAESLRSYPIGCHLHPFLRRLALESLQAAADALEGGGTRGAAES